MSKHKKYKVTLTEKQMQLVGYALESFFRIRMGQDYILSEDLASSECDLSSDNPKHKEIFDSYIQRRDAIREVLRAAFHIAWGTYGAPKEKSDDVCKAITIWDAIRDARGINMFGSPVMQSGDEPIPKIEVIEE